MVLVLIGGLFVFFKKNKGIKPTRHITKKQDNLSIKSDSDMTLEDGSKKKIILLSDESGIISIPNKNLYVFSPPGSSGKKDDSDYDNAKDLKEKVKEYICSKNDGYISNKLEEQINNAIDLKTKGVYLDI